MCHNLKVSLICLENVIFIDSFPFLSPSSAVWLICLLACLFIRSLCLCSFACLSPQLRSNHRSFCVFCLSLSNSLSLCLSLGNLTYFICLLFSFVLFLLILSFLFSIFYRMDSNVEINVICHVWHVSLRNSSQHASHPMLLP